MLNCKKIQVVAAFILAGCLFGCGRQAVPQGYLDDTGNDVYQAVLSFEEASRNAAEPCFLEMKRDDYDPAVAVVVCQAALQSLENVWIVDELPPKIADLLSEAQAVLLGEVEYDIGVSKYNMGEQSSMPFSMERERVTVSDIFNRARKIAQPL